MLSSVSTFFVLVVALTLLDARAHHVKKRMVNGTKVDISQVPWTVFVKSEEFDVCVGAIVSPWHVITAAHCTRGYIEFIEIRAGSTLRNQGGTTHRAAEVTRHEKFTVDAKQQSSSYDLAIVRVIEPFDFGTNVRPISLFKYGEKARPGQEGLESGWGKDESGKFEPHLKKLSLTVVDKAKCNEAYKSWGGLKPGQFCAKNENEDKYPCYGDSGGPLVINGKLAGVDIYGGSCELPGSPSVFTEIGYLRDWIDRNIVY